MTVSRNAKLPYISDVLVLLTLHGMDRITRKGYIDTNVTEWSLQIKIICITYPYILAVFCLCVAFFCVSLAWPNQERISLNFHHM